MKKSTFIIVLTFLLVLQGRAQRYYYTSYFNETFVEWEVGLTCGPMFGYTDVGTRKDITGTIKTPRFFAGVYSSVCFNDNLAVRLEANMGSITGDDKNGMYAKRNLNYTTSIREISLLGEWYVSSLYAFDKIPLISPYLAAGVGYLNFNPYTYVNGSKVFLQPLRTEGQGFSSGPNAPAKPYSLSRMNILMGTGAKFDVSEKVNLRLEFMVRITGTDYLDDVSTYYIDPKLFDANLSTSSAVLAKTVFDRSNPKDPKFSGPGSIRGDPHDKDCYWSIGFKLGIKFSRD